MDTLWLLTAIALAWSGVGFVVALLLGRLFRTAGAAREEAANRLIC